MHDEATTAPSTGPSAAAINPWVQGAASIGTAALGFGVLLAVLGGPASTPTDAGPAAIRLVIGVCLGVVGLGLLLCALIIVGVGWYFRHPQPR